jgi:hypothetical protein
MVLWVLALRRCKRAIHLINTSKMPVMRASLLLHRGFGPRHGDLILGTGARCFTLRVGCRQGRWQIAIADPHRRRYLTYRGVVGGGRGTVDVLWSGLLEGWCSLVKQRWSLRPKAFFMSKLRRISGTNLQPPKGFLRSSFVALEGAQGQGVVRQLSSQTLSRS